jgi:CRP-like cAMP-binding protein
MDRARLARVPLLAGLAAGDLAALTEGAWVETYDLPTQLFAQGDPADRFFVLLDGRVTIYALTESGDQAVIEVFERACSFAEAAIFSTGVYPLHGEVAAGTRLIHIPAAPFLRRLGERPDLGLILLAGLARWQDLLAEEIFDLKRRSPAERLARALLDRAAAGEEGQPLPKALLARRIGITPESLSRALARLAAHGVGRSGPGAVEIRDPAALQRFIAQAEDEP